jgi:hypothetical protein
VRRGVKEGKIDLSYDLIKESVCGHHAETRLYPDKKAAK